VCGLVQDGIGYVDGEPRIALHMEAYLGAPETYDRVVVEGSPRLDVRADGGYHGDVATASITVNSIPNLLRATPGLHTMRSLALPSFAGGR
jgi:4-hydroxy-tetrahydrodipicolinate reductase